MASLGTNELIIYNNINNSQMKKKKKKAGQNARPLFLPVSSNQVK